MGPVKFKAKIKRGRRLTIMFQNTRKTSLPKSVNERNMKNKKTSKNFCKFYSYVSSGFPEFDPLFAPGALLGPNISSHVKLRVKRAGNRPRPMTNPPF